MGVKLCCRMTGHNVEACAWSALYATTAAERRIAARDVRSEARMSARLNRPGGRYRSMCTMLTTGVRPEARDTSAASAIGRLRNSTEELRASRAAVTG